jgi:hypothetical protein
MIQKYKTKILIAVLSLAMAIVAIASSLAYFSSYQIWGTEQIIETGIFNLTIDSEKLKQGSEGAYTVMEFKAPTIINLPEISDSENELQHILFLRRGDDDNFDNAIEGLQLNIFNLCNTSIIFKISCNFYLGDLTETNFDFETNAIDFIKYFIISDIEKQNIENNGVIETEPASYKNYIRYYAKTLTPPETTITVPSTLTYSYLRLRMNEIRQFNDEMLNQARNISSAENEIFNCTYNNDVLIPTIKSYYLFFWVDYASLEEYYKSGETDDAYINTNNINEMSNYSGLNISSKLTVDFTQSSNTNFE